MDYKNTKYAMMESYPTLFVNEADVLEHLFFINGCGYDWVNGELIDGYQSAEEQIAESKERHRSRIIRDFYDTLRRSWYRGRLNDLKGELVRLASPNYAKNERQKERRRREIIHDSPRSIYPICKYATILNVPDDVKPDWLAAAKKAIGIAYTKFRLRPSDRVWLRAAKKRLKRFG